MYLVICKNHVEYLDYLRRNMVDTRDCVYLEDPYRLRGIKNPRGVFTGKWHEREDMLLIFRELNVANIDPKKLMQAVDYYHRRRDNKPAIKVQYHPY